MYYIFGITDTGKVRTHNEDAFLAGKKVTADGAYEKELKPPFIAAVADGVAGELSGELASHFVLKNVAKIKPSKTADYKSRILKIHDKLKKTGVKNNSPNCQTTLCALAIDKNENATVIHAGDSRLYRFKGNTIRQITDDQSLIQSLYKDGAIAEEEKYRHAQKNVIFPVLGNTESEPQIVVQEIDRLEQSEIVFICTDGLSDYITKGVIEDVLSLPQNISKRVSSLIEKAAESGSKDNITALAIYKK